MRIFWSMMAAGVCVAMIFYCVAFLIFNPLCLGQSVFIGPSFRGKTYHGAISVEVREEIQHVEVIGTRGSWSISRSRGLGTGPITFLPLGFIRIDINVASA